MLRASCLIVVLFVVACSQAQTISNAQTFCGDNVQVVVTKSDKKLAKQYVKDGWKAGIGSHTIEEQLALTRTLREDGEIGLLAGSGCRCFYHASIAIGDTYDTAYANAYNNALIELASQIEIMLAAETDLESDTQSQTYRQGINTTVNGCLKDAIPTMAMYRYTDNRKVEALVGIILFLNK